MNATADRYRSLADAFERKIAAVDPSQWSNQSPCDEWTARGVVDHLVEVHTMMLGLIDRTPTPAASVDDDPIGAFHSARVDVQTVLDDPEIAATEYDGLLGHTTISATVDRFLGLDLVVHGWDLARATGQDERMPPDEVERLLAEAQQLGDDLRRPGVCGPAVEVGDAATRQDQLLGLLGRDPA